MENHTKMDDLGGKPTIFGNIHIITGTSSQEAIIQLIRAIFLVSLLTSSNPNQPGEFRGAEVGKKIHLIQLTYDYSM